jgi:hypothetical protein
MFKLTGHGLYLNAGEDVKVFWFFSSEKNVFFFPGLSGKNVSSRPMKRWIKYVHYALATLGAMISRVGK